MRRNNLCPVFEIRELQFQFVVEFWPKREIVGKHDTEGR